MAVNEPVDNPDVPVVEGTVLWCCSFYDGDINGVCLVDNRVCWYQTDADIDLDEHRDYYVYELTNEEFRQTVTTHLLFEHLVGLHCCNHASFDGQRQWDTVREGYKAFYDLDHPGQPDVTDRTPIGRLVHPRPHKAPSV